MFKNYLVIFAVLILLVVMIVPAHASNANLFISAENSQFSNYMSGPQVVEVVVLDSDIKDTSKAMGEPVVTINGKKLRMAQATDGNWYGYIADKTMAKLADATVTSAGRGLDFGQFCTSASSELSNDSTVLFSDTSGVAIPVRTTGVLFGSNGASTITSCSTSFNSLETGVIQATSTHTLDVLATGVEGRVSNVVREAKALSGVASGTQSGTSVSLGQIKLKDEGLWPFVQLYDFNSGGTVVVQYFKGGGVQTTTLHYNQNPQFIEVSLDKVKYTQGSDVLMTISYPWLNIDPTDEDSWTFSANNTNTATFGLYYQVFNEDGGNAGDSSTATLSTPRLTMATLDSLMCYKCSFDLNIGSDIKYSSVFSIQDNADSAVTAGNNIVEAATNGAKLGRNSVPLTFTETSANSAIFRSYDENNISSLKILDNTPTGFGFSLEFSNDRTGSSFVIPMKRITDEIVNGATTNEDTPVSIILTVVNPGNNILQYSVVTKPEHGILSGTAPNLTYTPTLNYFGGDYLTYRANDGKLDSGIKEASITVTSVDDIPVANAGIEQSVNVGATVQLDGSKSSDGDNDSITYSWIQTAGYPVTLTSTTIANPKLTAPAKVGQLTFILTVSDGKATSNPAVINIYVGSTVPVPIPPPSPTSLSTTVANGAIALKWTPPATDGNAVISDYVIEYKLKSDSSWKTHNDGISASTSATVSGLKNDKSYDFRISAVNSAGIGEKSSIVSAVPTNTVKPESPAVKPDDDKKIADKKIADKKIADKKIADKKAADAKKIADKKAADAKKVAKAKK